MIVTDKIDEDDFRELKGEYVSGIHKLEKRLITLQADPANVDELLELGLEKLLKLDEVCKKGELYEKRKLISAIYPENFTYDGYAVRTGRVNSIVHLIYVINKELNENKKGEIKNKFDFSSEVGVAGSLTQLLKS